MTSGVPPTAMRPPREGSASSEFPFTRYFYKYEESEPSEKILAELVALDKEIAAEFVALTETTATYGTTGTTGTTETGVAEVSSSAKGV